MTHRSCVLPLILTLAAGAAAQVDPAATPAPAAAVPADPQAAKVLGDAAAAAAALTSLSYTATFSGDLMGIKQKGRSEVIMLRDFEHEGRWLKRWIGTHEVVSMESTQIQVADQGDTITYITFPTREYHKENAKYVNPRGVESLVYAWIPEMAEGDRFNKMPFAKYLEAPGGVRMGVPEDVGGVPCDVVTADFGENQATRTWWIGADDHLPRKLQWTFKDAGSWSWEVSDLKLNPPLVPGMFELAVPEGFKRFDPPPPVVAGTQGSSVTAMEGGGLQTSAAKGERMPGLTVGTLAPDFTLPMIELDSSGPGIVPVKGKSFTLSAQRSHVVILDFFGSWNAQSKAAAPELARLAAATRGHPVKIVSLAVRERDESKPIEFLSQTPYATALLPAADEVAKLYKARVIPTYFVIGFEGEIIYTSSTYARESTVKEIRSAMDTYFQNHVPGKPAAEAAKDNAGDSTK